jgi:hypothetical protein
MDVASNSDSPVVIMLHASDPDANPLTYNIIGKPAHGVLSGSAPSLTFTPEKGFTGTDLLVFNVHDGNATSPPAYINIMVKPAGSAPKNNNDVLSGAPSSVTDIPRLNVDKPGDTGLKQDDGPSATPPELNLPVNEPKNLTHQTVVESLKASWSAFTSYLKSKFWPG